jgi:ribosome biogenesis GTPase A
MILNSLYNGSPPFEKDKAEENNIEINRNDLSGVNLLAQARRQWCQGFLKSGNFFTVQVDSGQPNHKREWSNTLTKHINRLLKRSKPMMEQSRATGANVMLHGIGAVTWKDRRSPVPVPLPVSSLLIASETDIDFENL